LIIFLNCLTIKAQQNPILIDEVIAVVGKNAIFKSDIDASVSQLQTQGAPTNFSTSCHVLEERLFEKLLVHKAEVDSVDVSDQEIDDAIDRRMNYMLMRLGGSDEDFFKYYGKTVLQFKKEIRGTVADNILGQKVRSKITSLVTISPSEVKDYFKSLPKDSLPVVPESYKIAQLVIKAKPGPYEKKRVEKKIK
jgi:peptidyl-prolyl cis-trans isomerase SurA